MRSIGLIGGSGLDRWETGGEPRDSETPWGPPSGPVISFSLPGARLLFLPRHGPAHDIPPHRVNYRANLWALREAGASVVIAVNAVGGITQAFAPGVLVLPDQLIDYTWGRAHSYSDGPGDQVQHVDFTQPFSAALSAELERAATRAEIAVAQGACIGVTQGPRLETAAEIARMRRDGCDLVGMTSMPEAGLARELGLDYASLCVVANHAAGTGGKALRMADIEACLAQTMVSVRQVIAALCGAG